MLLDDIARRLNPHRPWDAPLNLSRPAPPVHSEFMPPGRGAMIGTARAIPVR